MRVPTSVLGAVAACLLAGACGGLDAAEPTGSTGSAAGTTTATTTTSATVVTLPVEPTASVEPVEFPAGTAADVVALATQRPKGAVRYEVVAEEGTSTIELAQDEARARLHRVAGDAETWVGFDLEGRAVEWTCEASADGSPQCRDGDPDGKGAAAAAAVAQLVGNDAVRRTFLPATALPETGVGLDQQADQQVSCLAVTAEGRDLRLCATAEGIITQMTAGTTTARATAVSADVQPSDLEPPSAPD